MTVKSKISNQLRVEDDYEMVYGRVALQGNAMYTKMNRFACGRMPKQLLYSVELSDISHECWASEKTGAASLMSLIVGIFGDGYGHESEFRI